ncbi:MAG: phosphatase PAP2 family protein [Planctomycetota bacterium]
MWQRLLDLDVSCLRWVEGLRPSWLDGPMYVASHLEYALPFLALLWILLVWKGGDKGRRVALAIIVLFACTDLLNAHLIKPLVGRPRPHSDSFSFPSSHAVNLFAQAILLTLCYPRVGFVLYPLAAVVGFSRIYLGKHYPLDVVGGAFIGTGFGLLGYWLTRRLGRRLDRLWAFLRSPWKARSA